MERIKGNEIKEGEFKQGCRQWWIHIFQAQAKKINDYTGRRGAHLPALACVGGKGGG